MKCCSAFACVFLFLAVVSYQVIHAAPKIQNEAVIIQPRQSDSSYGRFGDLLRRGIMRIIMIPSQALNMIFNRSSGGNNNNSRLSEEGVPSTELRNGRQTEDNFGNGRNPEIS